MNTASSTVNNRGTINIEWLHKAAIVVEGVNRANGWYDEERSEATGDALTHSEISEALEAYRMHGMADMTLPDQTDAQGTPVLSKPEGVGSEMADVLIRMLDEGKRREKVPNTLPAVKVSPSMTFPDHLGHLHKTVATGAIRTQISHLLEVADIHGIDLAREFKRKIAFNRTRGYRHGNKKV